MRLAKSGLDPAGRPHWVVRLVPAVLMLVLAGVRTASAQYTIRSYQIGGGGTSQVVGGSYSLAGTVGQFDTGLLAGGTYTIGGGFWLGGGTLVGVEDEAGAPVAFRLHAAAPNPLVRTSRIVFELPSPRVVRLRVYDAMGRVTRTLAEGTLPAGRHDRTWDGRDEGGRPVEAGVYFVRFESDTDRAIQKVAVLR